MINCNKCGLINITEEIQQRHPDISHRCSLYQKRLFHRSTTLGVTHTMIYPCDECIADNHKGFKEINNERHSKIFNNSLG